MTSALASRERVAGEVAAVARVAAAAGLVEGFGHVSARAEGGFVITTTGPLGAQEAEDVLFVDASGQAEQSAGRPLETPMHAAIYRGRGDVGAIVRAHPPALVAVGASEELPPIAHGLGGLSGRLAVFADPQLVADDERAGAAAAALGDADVLILRANGALAVGADLEEALVRIWFAEERARVWLAAGRPAGLSEEELAERSRHWPAEARRAAAWLRWRYGWEEAR